MNEILTQNNKMVSPFTPNHEDILIDDIAHALSYLCRANGHFDKFYSVAQHSINCALEAKACNLSEKIQFACLLHDSAEAYMADIPKPVKEKFPAFSEAEDKLLKVIYSKFITERVTLHDFEEISRIDRVLLNEEFQIFKQRTIDDRSDRAKGELYFKEQPFKFYKKKFLTLFYYYSESLNYN